VNTLVIVESPAKARKIAGYLGPGYTVQASLGHVRDLPGSKAEIPERYRGESWANLGVNPQTFRPIYVVPESKQATVKQLQALASRADRVILASDDDREGESISWHLAQVLGLKEPQRMVFHEITREALQAAVKALRPIDLALVAAQEARRVIDRLVGYRVSPLLWNTVGSRLSAGRVQSAALMLLAVREMARMKFRPGAYWLIRARVKTRPGFLATVTHLKTRERPDGQALSKASDFTQDGVLKSGTDVLMMTDEQAGALCAYLDGKDATVLKVDQSETRTRPAPPFTTSTLQQAGGRLKLSAKGVMDTAQRLYDGGFITYMRTDSPALSDEALTEARKEAVRLFGDAAVPAAPRQYATRNKNAQEAHEAIRPAGVTWRPPESVGLSGDELALYTLIYQRTVASQMHDALYARTVVILGCGAATLQAQGRVLKEAGFTALLQGDGEKSNGEKSDEEQGDQRLPILTEGQQVPLSALPPEGKKTSAPPRFTEATLVQAMEKAGIGRPSTYAQTLQTLQTRDYARLQGRQLALSATGLLVATYLARQVPEVTRPDFTAGMEAGLDEVAAGTLTRTEYLTRFWTQGLEGVIGRAQDDVPVLPLPHLPGTVLRAGREGAVLVSGTVRVTPPVEVIPADLSQDTLAELLEGRWKTQAKKVSKPQREDKTGRQAKPKPAAGPRKPRGAAGKRSP
jgi:DNA topoisomerase-1